MSTIKDVARAAGVSVATVSRVYNGSARVSEATRRRVQEAADRLGYTAHGAARSLITSRTSTIGVLLPDLYGEFFSEIIRGIDQAAQERGYHLLVSSSHNDARELETAVQSMRGRVDGLIIMSPASDLQATVERFAVRFPLVLLNGAEATDGHEFDSIAVANFDGAYAMVQHLIRLGYRRIAIINGPERNQDAADRRAGYRAALRDAGAGRLTPWELPGDFTESAGYRAVATLLSSQHRPDAIFAANDATAIGALSALHDHHVAIPGDMALAGFDDIPTARYTNPPLSTVRVDIRALGARATSRLLDAVRSKGQHVRRQETLPAALVIRRSCGGTPSEEPVPPRLSQEEVEPVRH